MNMTRAVMMISAAIGAAAWYLNFGYAAAFDLGIACACGAIEVAGILDRRR